MSSPEESPLAPYDELLDRAGGSPDLLREVIGLFLEDAPTLLAGIKTGVGAGDAAGTRRSAHALKGSAANFGAPTLVGLARQVEQAAASGDLSAAAARVPGLETELRRLSSALAVLAGEIGPGGGDTAA